MAYNSLSPWPVFNDGAFILCENVLSLSVKERTLVVVASFLNARELFAPDCHSLQCNEPPV